LQVKLIKHSHIKAIGAGMRDRARVHKGASTILAVGAGVLPRCRRNT
jgi:hypothetical protein